VCKIAGESICSERRRRSRRRKKKKRKSLSLKKSQFFDRPLFGLRKCAFKRAMSQLREDPKKSLLGGSVTEMGKYNIPTNLWGRKWQG